MRILSFFVAISSLCVLGCISSSSVHPILTDDDLLHDVDLNGTWQQIEVKEKEQGFRIPDFRCDGWDDNARYNLTVVKTCPQQKFRKGKKEMPLQYDVAIGSIADDKFLQLRRSELITGGPSFYEGIVTHTFAKFDVKDDVLLVYPINDHALETLLPDTTMAHLMHKPSDWARNIVITESTPRLKEFLEAHGEILFFSQPLKFRRVKPKSDE